MARNTKTTKQSGNKPSNSRPIRMPVSRPASFPTHINTRKRK
nr:MAG TPA: hypothetical protein [Crassvirales sp.]